jgi:hypothetical protein
MKKNENKNNLKKKYFYILYNKNGGIFMFNL